MSTKPPTLTDAKGMGGVNASAGFDYQLWAGLERLPGWIRNPAFDGMIFEGLEDIEARFFSAHAPQQHFVDRFQAKSGALTPAAVREVFESFQSFDRHYPKAARVQTLLTPRLPTSLGWIERDADRVSASRPFYAPFPTIAAANSNKYLQDLQAEFGRELGSFIWKSAQAVECDYRNWDEALTKFSIAFRRAFPNLQLEHGQLQAGFESLVALGRKSQGTMLSRHDLTQALSMSMALNLEQRSAIVHIVSDVSPPPSDAVLIDGRRYSGPEYPAPHEWGDELVEPISKTATWLLASGRCRIRLSGRFRLSAGVILGHGFRSANGFEIEIPTKDAIWATDERPDEEHLRSAWTFSRPTEMSANRLAVSVGVIRDPAPEVRRYLGGGVSMLSASYPAPIISGRQAQALTGALKAEISRLATELSVSAIDLYLSTPAAFAVCVGHRWNGLPPTQLYEYRSASRDYVPTAKIH